MKKKLLFSFTLLAMATLLPKQSKAYDFSAVAPSGQTLYYNFQNDGEGVYVVWPNTNAQYYNETWDGYTKPTGDLTIPNSVTYDGQEHPVQCILGAFYNCTELTSVTIPSSVTLIGNRAFYGCSGLTGSLTIPNSVTYIGGWTFYDCSGLTAVNLNAVNCTTMGYLEAPVFYGCTALATLNIGDSVTNIPNYAFYNCSSLTGSLTIPNSVTSIGNSSFYNCSSLTGTLTIPNSVTSIGNSSFYGCSGLTGSLIIPNSVRTIGHSAFRGCSALTSLTIPNSITSIDENTFYGCSGLTSLTIGTSVTSINGYAFYNCSGLEEIHSLAALVPSLGTDAFSGVSTTIPVYVPCGCQNAYYSRWTYFSNIIEGSAASLSVASSDITMGTAQVLLAPTCDNPQAIVMATPNSGYLFDHWSDNSTANPYTLTVTTDMTLTAYFVSAGGGTEGIDDITAEDIKIYSRGSEIVIEGAENADALIYDIMGRIVHRGRIEGSIRVNNMGVYMVKVGDMPARKVVVR